MMSGGRLDEFLCQRATGHQFVGVPRLHGLPALIAVCPGIFLQRKLGGYGAATVQLRVTGDITLFVLAELLAPELGISVMLDVQLFQKAFYLI